jgi:hypothetical protein
MKDRGIWGGPIKTTANKFRNVSDIIPYVTHKIFVSGVQEWNPET